MYKPLTLVFSYLLLPMLGMSQPEISEAIIPAFGDSIHVVKCAPAPFQENNFGANQTWDFSGLTADAMEPDFYFKFFDPANTPHAARYPDATLAAINADSQYIYYVFENNLLQLIGTVFEDEMLGTAYAEYDNSETEEVFPISYENTWTDAFDGNNILGVFSSPFNGSIEGEVDAYGTLILPSGTFNNVLRVKEERNYQITGAPAMASTMYRYISADFNLWLLTMESFDSGPPLIFYRDNPELISSNQSLDVSTTIQLSPNPVQSNQAIYLKGKPELIEHISCYNSQGLPIQLRYTQLGNTTTKIQFLGTLPTGVYYLHGVSETAYFSKKIIVK